MANTAGGRQRLLQIYEIFKKSSDEKRPLTKVQICKLLSEQFDVYADQRTVKDDINCLLSMGYIACDSKNSYHYTMHPFEDWELKMLIDGIAQTDYFEPRTLNHTIEKIIALASPTDAEMLHRNSPVFNYTVKDCDLYLSENLSRIVHAIKELHPIKFEYFKLDENKVPVPYHNGIYTVHPYAILKRNAFYYLVSYSDGDSALHYFRMDRMRNVTILENQKRLSPSRLPIGDKTDEINRYLRNNTDSFSGENISVLVQLSGSPSILYDVFGIENVTLSACDGSSVFYISAQENDGLYHNLLRLGSSITVLAPASVQARYKHELTKMIAKYPETPK